MDILADNEYWAEQERAEQFEAREATRKAPRDNEAEMDAYYFQCEQMHDRNR